MEHVCYVMIDDETFCKIEIMNFQPQHRGPAADRSRHKSYGTKLFSTKGRNFPPNAQNGFMLFPLF